MSGKHTSTHPFGHDKLTGLVMNSTMNSSYVHTGLYPKDNYV